MNSKQNTILLTGGHTLLGTALTTYFRSRGYRVLWLTQDVAGSADLCDEAFYWDLDTRVLAPHPLTQAGTIIHTAGAALFAKPWTPLRKRHIARTRILTTRRLAQAIAQLPEADRPQNIILTSSVTYYGANYSPKWIFEDHPAGADFLAKMFSLLEQEIPLFESLGLRTTALRNGLILDPTSSILANLKLPTRLGLNLHVGSGKQYVNWIHIDDLCRLYEFAIEQGKMEGIYNATSPGGLTNEQFAHALSVHRRARQVRLPLSETLLRSLIGEMAGPLLYSGRVSADKLLHTGFVFEYDSLGKALRSKSSK